MTPKEVLVHKLGTAVLKQKQTQYQFQRTEKEQKQIAEDEEKGKALIGMREGTRVLLS